MRLLLVDDNALNLELFSDVLEQDGHEVIAESDSLRGQRRALAEPFDLIILDIEMPGLDGYAMCRSLRRSGRQGPTIALSSNAMPDHIAQGRDAGPAESKVVDLPSGFPYSPIDTRVLRRSVLWFARQARGERRHR